MIYGPNVIVVEWSFEAQHKGTFASHMPTGAQVKVPGTGVFEYDSAKRQITAVRIYFDMATLLQLITDSLDDRQNATAALQSNERNLSLIINPIPTSVWSAGPDGSVGYLNRRWLDYAGMTAEQAEGWGWAEAIHPDDRRGLIEYWQLALAAGEPVETEARMRRFDGVYRWFHFCANPLRDESGWYLLLRDIDDSKKAAEALQSNERNLSLIINTIPSCARASRTRLERPGGDGA